MNRVGWVDSAKGLGITLVVIGHVWRGVFLAGVSNPDGIFAFIDRAIYAFHMPLFFFCSGLFFFDLVKRMSLGRFIQSRLVRLFWPMVLWTWLFFILKLFAGEMQNTEVSLANFPLIPVPPLYHFWFIWALFLIHLAVGCVLMLTSRRLEGRAGAVGFVCAGIALVALADIYPLSDDYFGAAYGNAGFFIVAVGLGAWSSDRFSAPVAIAALGLAVALILLGGTGFRSNLHAQVVIILLCVGICWMDSKPDGQNGVFSKMFRYLGVASLAIYMLHTVFSAGLREVLLRLDVTDAIVHVVAGTAIGLVLPVAIYRFALARGVNRYVGL